MIFSIIQLVFYIKNYLTTQNIQLKDTHKNLANNRLKIYLGGHK